LNTDNKLNIGYYMAGIKRGAKERRAFAKGYNVVECEEEVNEEPPCRELYNTWMNGRDSSF